MTAPDPIAGIIPPHNSEAEQALIGALLFDNRVFERVGDRLQPEHFAEGIHGRIYSAISTLIQRGRRADPITLKTAFDHDEALADVGGSNYLSKLATSVVTIINAEDYAATIRDCWERRAIIQAASDAIKDAVARDIDRRAGDIREALENELIALDDSVQTGKGPQHIGTFGTEAIATAERAYKRQGRLTGVPTGLSEIDHITGGLQPSDLIYLAGRPSMGKSALAGTVALNAARAGHPVFIATPEMSGEQVALRSLSIRTRLSSQHIRSGQITPNDFQRLMEANTDDLVRLPILVDDTGGISLAQLRSRLRRFIRQAHKLPGARIIDDKLATPLLVVDYIQLMSPAGRRREQNRNEDMSELSRGLKGLAKEYGVPVLALSQLSRAVENRDNKRPMLNDLRDSGSLEQDADVVAFIYREEYYLAREEPTRKAIESAEKYEARFADWQTQLDRVKNIAEVIFAKQRHGPTAKTALFFDPQTTSFDNLARDGWSRTEQMRTAP